jgi:adenylate kinase family enzyme
LEEREADDEAIFKKQYKEYMQENKKIVRKYQERGLLMEVDTSKGIEESWKKLYTRLEKDVRWTDIIEKKV